MSELLLGKATPLVKEYSPELLYPVPRSEARARLGIDCAKLPFLGEDVWHGWELSWLDENCVPQVAVGRFRFPCSAPNLVESKSFKLYLNSLNFASVASWERVARRLATDLSEVAQEQVHVELLPLDAPQLAPQSLPGVNIDSINFSGLTAAPAASLIEGIRGGGGVWHSHLLRSLCPVTGQPDWGSIIITSDDTVFDEVSLLRYILSFREHQEYHEQCVERIFLDLMQALRPAQLSVQALYSRRGGLDINPWRSSDQSASPVLRTTRQ